MQKISDLFTTKKAHGDETHGLFCIIRLSKQAVICKLFDINNKNNY
jgi:hypothetical protein